ncbi:MAG: hypothetical protein ABFC96_16545 [Thermoguttaceae bacterium]
MTQLLTKAFEEATRLPEVEQNALAKWLLDEVIPNATTRKTLDDADSGEGLVTCKDAEDMFRKLGV